jgi:SAM-dependent methyltransferase
VGGSNSAKLHRDRPEREHIDVLNRQVIVVALAIGLAVLITPRLIFLAKRSAAPQKLAPYVQTPQDVVERMLLLAQVGRDDVVYDLGCGDGRLVITAARKYGARGVGVDFDLNRVRESQANAARAGVEALVEFRQQDALTVDVSPATVVTLYLLTSSNLKLRPILTRALRPGARIVSHQFGMGDWEPDTQETLTEPDGSTHIVYLWKADGQVRP